jgi:hypothetical protein
MDIWITSLIDFRSRDASNGLCSMTNEKTSIQVTVRAFAVATALDID